MANRISQIKSEIIQNIKIQQDYYKIILNSLRIAKVSQPGQFVQVKVSNSTEPFLRRPFSIHRVGGQRITILYEAVGRATEILSHRKAGEYLDIIGPLGCGFDLRLAISNKRQAILVAGGMGVAPLVFLAEKLRKRKTLVLLGAKTDKQLLCNKEFRDLGCEVKIATDNGSKGFKGKVTDLLKKILPLAISHKPLAIYACGPKPMLREISHLAQKHNLPTQISLEEHLACGIGACLGCVVNTKEGYQRVCTEGPVFYADEIIW